MQQGWESDCTGFAVFALVPAFGVVAGAIAIPTVASLLLIAVFGHETRGRDLREMETKALIQEA